MWFNLKTLLLLGVLVLFPFCQAEEEPEWFDVIRSIPYTYSKNFQRNLSTIRQWVLLQQGYCEQPQRHIFYDTRGEFVSYIDNLWLDSATQQKLNETRKELSAKGKVSRWVSGSEHQIGYPFALNCDQPHADIDQAIQRLLGSDAGDRLWGTWDGISAGTEDSPIPLYQLTELVYKTKSQIIKQEVVGIEYRYFLAQIIIESGAHKDRLSKDNAIGLLQLKPNVLQDCQISKQFYRHRMAQVDCAVRLFQQNRRNLRPIFDAIFGELPEAKKDILFSLLLVQSYHSGIGRINRLLTDKDFNQASLFFAKNHQDYSAEDIASGIIFHNLGRSQIGFASLYYVIDVAITAERICQQQQLHNTWVCSSAR